MKECLEWWCKFHHTHLMCCTRKICDQNFHLVHCCIIHGCKYNDPNCGVALGKLTQKYACDEEDCNPNLSLQDNIRSVSSDEEEYF